MQPTTRAKTGCTDRLRIKQLRRKAWNAEDRETYRELTRKMRTLPSRDPYDPPYDPNFRRLTYCRYADDFILGFTGPRKEAREIRRQLAEFLADRLKLELSMEKTVITHAMTGRANFLGYDIDVPQAHQRLTTRKDGKKMRATNAKVFLRVPREAINRTIRPYVRYGKPKHRTDIINESDYTIVSRYQSVLRGIYNYYCLGINAGASMGRLKWLLEQSLVKTLARKHKCKASDILRKYQTRGYHGTIYRVIVERPNKKPLVAVFGDIEFKRKPHGLKNVGDVPRRAMWNFPATKRAEVVQRLIAGKCELCGAEGITLQAHHIRKLADVKRTSNQPLPKWKEMMHVRKRKTLMVCKPCHDDIHAGRYDGSKLRDKSTWKAG